MNNVKKALMMRGAFFGRNACGTASAGGQFTCHIAILDTAFSVCDNIFVMAR
jgi:hypothetical protein